MVSTFQKPARTAVRRKVESPPLARPAWLSGFEPTQPSRNFLKLFLLGNKWLPLGRRNVAAVAVDEPDDVATAGEPLIVVPETGLVPEQGEFRDVIQCEAGHRALATTLRTKRPQSAVIPRSSTVSNDENGTPRASKASRPPCIRSTMPTACTTRQPYSSARSIA